MTQTSLDFGLTDRAQHANRRVLTAVNNAVEAIGLSAAADACDAKRSELNDALSGRESRYLRSEWLIAIVLAAPDEHRVAILRALLAPCGFDLVATPAITPEQERDILRAYVRAMPLGEEHLARALGGRR